MTRFIPVSKDEFDAFIAAYPRPLVRNVTTICEPPNVNFNDFERAPYWPDSVVASYMAFTSYEDETPTSHCVISDINSPVEDGGDRDTDTPLTDKNGTQVREGDRVLVSWGGTIWSDGVFAENQKDHVVMIRDKGTKYERWSMHDCHNYLRGFSFEILP